MEVEDENQGSQVGEHVNATPQQGNSASVQKTHLPSATPTSSTTNSKEKVSGFRFVDTEILSSVFELLSCNCCKEYELELLEDCGKRKGCASKA